MTRYECHRCDKGTFKGCIWDTIMLPLPKTGTLCSNGKIAIWKEVKAK